MTFLSKLWSYVKAYWFVPVGIGLVILAYVIGKGDMSGAAKLLKDARDQHEAEIKIIDEVNAEKEQKKEAANQRARDALEFIEARYEEANKELDEKERAKVQKLLAKAKNDPKEMDKLVEKMTGIKVVTVED